MKKGGVSSTYDMLAYRVLVRNVNRWDHLRDVDIVGGIILKSEVTFSFESLLLQGWDLLPDLQAADKQSNKIVSCPWLDFAVSVCWLFSTFRAVC